MVILALFAPDPLGRLGPEHHLLLLWMSSSHQFQLSSSIHSLSPGIYISFSCSAWFLPPPPCPPPSLGFPSVMYQGSLVYSTPPAPLRSLPLPVLCSQSLSHQLELTFFMLLNYLIFYYMFLQILIFIFLHTCFLFHF